jgi:uncharacterized damage-inducible protein DinB/DNA-binding CsgD family transcriptional regulator
METPDRSTLVILPTCEPDLCEGSATPGVASGHPDGELRDGEGAGDSPLTGLERAVLSGFAAGLSEREIALQLMLFEPAIRAAVRSSCRKLAVRSRAAAVAHPARRFALPGARMLWWLPEVNTDPGRRRCVVAAGEMIERGFRPVWQAVQRNVEAMPDARLDYRPEGLETRSFREIALHIADASVFFGENIGKTVWERFTTFPADTYRTKAQVLEAVRQGGERYLAALPRLTDQEAARMVQPPFGGSFPQGVLVGFQVPHTFYHNGQLAIYLRLAGVKPVFVVR